MGLQMALTEFGPVKEAKVIMDRDTGKSRGFGFVTFESETDAQAAVKTASIQLDGRDVRIAEADEKPSRGGGGGGRGGGGRHGSGNRGGDRY
jgi:RNA recognition motif-containing protein